MTRMIGDPQYRRVFGYREMYGFGRTSIVVAPGRQFATHTSRGTATATKVREDGITEYTFNGGQVGYILTYFVREKREVTSRA